jgi:hypothetical protein
MNLRIEALLSRSDVGYFRNSAFSKGLLHCGSQKKVAMLSNFGILIDEIGACWLHLSGLPPILAAFIS